MNSRTILLVDDDPSIVAVLQHALTQVGYGVVIAADGRRALGRFAEHRQSIDLVITDLQMPDVGGLELARCLRRECPSLPIIFISGNSGAGPGPTEVEFPQHLFWRKPFLASDLVAQLSHLLTP